MNEFNIKVARGTSRAWRVTATDPSGTQGLFVEADDQETALVQLASVLFSDASVRIMVGHQDTAHSPISKVESVRTAIALNRNIIIDYTSPSTGKVSKGREVLPRYETEDGDGFVARQNLGDIRVFKYAGLDSVKVV